MADALPEVAPPAPVLPDGKSAPIDVALMEEIKHREAELDQLGRCLLLANSKAVADYDTALQARALLQHELASCDGGVQALLAQRVLDLLDGIEGDETQPEHEQRTRQLVDSYDTAKAALLEGRSTLECSAGDDKVAGLIAKHETAAIAAESLRRQHARRVTALTKQLCDKEIDIERLEDAVKQKTDQLRAAHDALAHTTAQLAAVTGTTKEVSRLQEEKHALATELGVTREAVADHEGTIRQLRDELVAVRNAHASLGDAAQRIDELSEAHAVAVRYGEDLAFRCDEQGTRLAVLEQQLASRTDALDNASVGMTELHESVAALTDERDKLRAESEALRAAHAADGDKIALLEQSLEGHKGRLAYTSEELAAALASCDIITAVLRELVDDGQQLLSDLSWSKTCEKLKVEFLNMRDSLANERATSADFHTKNKDLHTRLLVCEQRLAEIEELELVQQEAQLQKESLAESQLKQLRERAADIDKRETDVTARDIEARGREETLRQREDRLDRSERELALRRQEFGLAALNTTITNSRLDELTMLLEGKETELREIRAQNTTLADRVRCLDIEGQQGEEKCGQLDRVVNIARGQLKDNALQLDALSNELQVARERLGEELANRDTLEGTVRELTGQLKEYETEISMLRNDIERADAGTQRHTEVLGDLQAAHESRVVDIQQLHDEERAELLRRMGDLQAARDADIASLNARMAEMQAAHEQALAEELQRRNEDIAQLQLLHESDRSELLRSHDGVLSALRSPAAGSAHPPPQDLAKQHAGTVADMQAAHEAEKGALMRKISELQALHEKERGELLARIVEADSARAAAGNTAGAAAGARNEVEPAAGAVVLDLQRELASTREALLGVQAELAKSKEETGELEAEIAKNADAMLELQRELAKREAQADDAVRTASNVWNGVARLARKFEDFEQNVPSGGTLAEKYDVACSFIRYIRGWLSLYKGKDGAAGDKASTS